MSVTTATTAETNNGDRTKPARRLVQTGGNVLASGAVKVDGASFWSEDIATPTKCLGRITDRHYHTKPSVFKHLNASNNSIAFSRQNSKAFVVWGLVEFIYYLLLPIYYL